MAEASLPYNRTKGQSRQGDHATFKRINRVGHHHARLNGQLTGYFEQIDDRDIMDERRQCEPARGAVSTSIASL